MDNIKYYKLIDRKTIQNIKRTLVNNSYHPDNSTSTFLKIESLRQEKHDPVLLYKRQYHPNSTHCLNTNDFVVVIMTKEQQEMYEKICPNCTVHGFDTQN